MRNPGKDVGSSGMRFGGRGRAMGGLGGGRGKVTSTKTSETTDTGAQSIVHDDVMALMRSDPKNPRIFSYTGPQIALMGRKMMAAFEGCGGLFFSRDKFDRPDGLGLWALKNVSEVERLVRQTLLDPLVDKQLRGEKLTSEEQAQQAKESVPAGEEAEDIPPNENIKDYVRSGKAKAAEKEDPNLKMRPADLQRTVAEAPQELREEVEAELTEGEKILWIGVPEGKVKGRGILGAITGAEIRYEPDYYIYAITNRRVLLFCEKGSTDSQAATFGGSKDPQGPVTYYPSQLQACGLETDERLPEGGGIVFKRVKRIIQTVSTESVSGSKTQKRGVGRHAKMVTTKYSGSSTSVSTRTENHHFGILRIRNYIPVARFLAETLILPIRG